jgi:hypothetical protein
VMSISVAQKSRTNQFFMFLKKFAMLRARCGGCVVVCEVEVPVGVWTESTGVPLTSGSRRYVSKRQISSVKFAQYALKIGCACYVRCP